MPDILLPDAHDPRGLFLAQIRHLLTILHSSSRPSPTLWNSAKSLPARLGKRPKGRSHWTGCCWP